MESRGNWKVKNTAKSKRINNLSRQLDRQGKASRHHYKLLVVQLCVVLRVFCGCSYRGVSKIIKVLASYSILELSGCPSATTVQNWVTKTGLYQRQSVENELVGKNRILIIDESIRIGKEKQLLVLSTPFEKTREDSLKAKDVTVHYFGGRTNWNGKQISEVIEEVLSQTKIACQAVLSDEGSTLKKASRLQELPHLPDICHAIGTCLKQVFEKNPDYKSLMTLLRKYRQKGVNRDLSYLLPPKQGSKARFLNVNESIKWAEGMLTNFEKLSREERDFFSELSDHQSIVLILKECLQMAKTISLPLKKQGIGLTILEKTKTNIAQEKQKAENADKTLVALFLTKLATYITQYQSFIEGNGGENIPVSSEIIESLFGVYKNLASSNQLVGATFLNFEIDVRCMEENEIEEKLKDALEMTFMTDLKNWKKEHSSDSQIVRRRKFFKNGV